MTRMIRKSFVLFATAALLASSTSYSAAEKVTGQVVETQSVSAWSTLSDISASYSAVVHGPAVNHLGENETVDSTGRRTAPGKSDIYFDSTATLGYKFYEGELVTSAYVPFFLIPSVESTDAISNGGQHLVMGDVGAMVSAPHAYRAGGFSASANLILQAPTSTYSREVTKMSLGIKTTPGVRYAFSGTDLAVGSLFEFKEYAGVTNKQKSFKSWYLPYAQYKLFKSLDAKVGFEYEASHFRGSGSTLSVVSADFQPGLVWFITPHVLVNPYVQVYTNDTVNSEHMALGAFVSASM